MKQFGKILKFELKNYAKNKAFVGVTIFLMVAIAIVMFFPRITALFESDDPSEKKATMIRLVENYDIDEVKVFEPSLNDIFVEYAGDAAKED